MLYHALNINVFHLRVGRQDALFLAFFAMVFSVPSTVLATTPRHRASDINVDPRSEHLGSVVGIRQPRASGPPLLGTSYSTRAGFLGMQLQAFHTSAAG